MQLLPSNIFVGCKTAIWRSFEIFFYLSVCGFWHADEYLIYVQSAITDMATIRNFEVVISKR